MRYLSSFALVLLVTGMPDLARTQEFYMSVVPDDLGLDSAAYTRASILMP